MNLDEKIEKVENTIKNRKIAIAFSGGADSTLLAYLASKVSDKPIAITIDNHIFPTGFIKHCKKTAKEFGIKHKVIDLNFYEYENLLSNKSDRCFVCRDLMYGNIKKYATDNGYESVLDGNNISDLVLDRPGILITYKNNIESPFIHAKLTSKERNIRNRLNSFVFLVKLLAINQLWITNNDTTWIKVIIKGHALTKKLRRKKQVKLLKHYHNVYFLNIF